MTPVSAVSSGRKPSPGFCLLLLNLCCPPSPLSFNLFKIQKQLFLPSTQPRVPFTLHVQLLTLFSFLICLKSHPLRLRSSSLGTNWQEEHRKYINHAAKELFTLRLRRSALIRQLCMRRSCHQIIFALFLLVSSLLVGVVYSKKTYCHPHGHFSESEASKPLVALVTSAGTWVRVPR